MVEGHKKPAGYQTLFDTDFGHQTVPVFIKGVSVSTQKTPLVRNIEWWCCDDANDNNENDFPVVFSAAFLFTTYAAEWRETAHKTIN